MKFISQASYLFKVTPVMKKDDKGNDTKELAFYRLTFRDVTVSNSNIATTSYFDVIPTEKLANKYGDTFVDMTGKNYYIEGTVTHTYIKETKKSYTNFRLETLTEV